MWYFTLWIIKYSIQYIQLTLPWVTLVLVWKTNLGHDVNPTKLYNSSGYYNELKVLRLKIIPKNLCHINFFLINLSIIIPIPRALVRILFSPHTITTNGVFFSSFWEAFTFDMLTRTSCSLHAQARWMGDFLVPSRIIPFRRNCYFGTDIDEALIQPQVLPVKFYEALALAYRLVIFQYSTQRHTNPPQHSEQLYY